MLAGTYITTRGGRSVPPVSRRHRAGGADAAVVVSRAQHRARAARFGPRPPAVATKQILSVPCQTRPGSERSPPAKQPQCSRAHRTRKGTTRKTQERGRFSAQTRHATFTCMQRAAYGMQHATHNTQRGMRNAMNSKTADQPNAPAQRLAWGVLRGTGNCVGLTWHRAALRVLRGARAPGAPACPRQGTLPPHSTTALGPADADAAQQARSGARGTQRAACGAADGRRRTRWPANQTKRDARHATGRVACRVACVAWTRGMRRAGSRRLLSRRPAVGGAAPIARHGRSRHDMNKGVIDHNQMVTVLIVRVVFLDGAST
jgi:hypothetical protein